MKLIVGLGNPGAKYQNNRHNVGFMFIDFMVRKLESLKGIKLKEEKILPVTCYPLPALILAKPNTFMNQSGLAVKRLLSNLPTFKPSNLVIVHDDLDIPLGKFKIQKGIGPKVHNGLKSIEKALKTKDFWRIRIGVDNRQPDRWIEGETYVLTNFLPEEKKIIINQVFPKIFSRLDKPALG